MLLTKQVNCCFHTPFFVFRNATSYDVLGGRWITSTARRCLTSRRLRTSQTRFVYGTTCHLATSSRGFNRKKPLWIVKWVSVSGWDHICTAPYFLAALLRQMLRTGSSLFQHRKRLKWILRSGTHLLLVLCLVGYRVTLSSLALSNLVYFPSKESTVAVQVKSTGYEALEEALIRERLQQKTASENNRAKDETSGLESKKGTSGNSIPLPSEKRFQNLAELDKSNPDSGKSNDSSTAKEESSAEVTPHVTGNSQDNKPHRSEQEVTEPKSSERISTTNERTGRTILPRTSIGSMKLWIVRLRQRIGDTLDHIREVNLLEDRFLSNLRLPTQRETFAVLSQFTLVCALILLLRAGVNRTLRWVYARFDPNANQLSYEQSVFECMQRPLEFLAVATVIISLAEFVSRPLAATGLLRYIRPFRELTVIFSATWFLLRWIERIRSRFTDSSTYEARVNKAQVDALSRIMTVVVSAIALLISLDTFGINIQTVLAFGGIGGVAIGFAGREIISNFFGGFMIYLTQPFAVGDWVRSIENDQIDGSVEEIGWYLTRIRTWEKRPLYIPNSRFSTLVMENPSRMTNRRIKHTIGLAMEDMCVIKDIIQDIQNLLDQHPELDPKQHRMVWFDGFGEYSVNLWLSCYTKTVFLSEYRRVQQEILFAVYDIIRSHHGRLASSLVRDLREGSDPDKYAPLHPLSELSKESFANGTNHSGSESALSWSRHEPESNKPEVAVSPVSEDTKKEKGKSSSSPQSGTMRIKGPGRSNMNNSPSVGTKPTSVNNQLGTKNQELNNNANNSNSHTDSTTHTANGVGKKTTSSADTHT
ncbi:Low conductance mechanosensitive channel YnaI [Galdieria sulphuraria]|uniref:Small conductance mechanosensitive ion channel, MscS family n=1 Tax=Galdieria sulphuraria TaxID=130081 RepID=M2WTW7_GALSU|nr:small conductance mechanosensitive ion channel, MscS family [Galdieria sulphuraria]EME27340.1 small conductance mechanosensitive ion channel, MscS family [Galdieria sulphuraria]GJD09493.1 Low conductance mechanosensitive channel YnaI [Galdieria sulphuraria]|eukprot:XP_005703860.1 small conductance mechanosensitive ion channel, MscS family [Galdieria sulphuraria]